MNPLLRWFHQLGSPPYFDRFAARWAPWAYGLGLLVMAWGLYGALFVVPADYQQGNSFRILYIHVPSAWMSMAVFGLMAVYAAIALVWRIKLCEILAMACAPIGAGFTLITLLTGSIWGKGTWGTWWDWDPRMTSELVLLFLYLGVIGLYHAIEDRRSAARAAGLLAIVGVSLLPVIPANVPPTLSAAAKFITALRIGVNWKVVDYISEAERTIRQPVLIHHGTADLSVPLEESLDLVEANPDLIRLIQVEGAGHVESYDVDRQKYVDEVVGFLQGLG